MTSGFPSVVEPQSGLILVQGEGLQTAWLGLEAEETVHGFGLLPAEPLDSLQSQDLGLRLKS